MIGYNPSHLNKNETLLEAFHRVEAYLKTYKQGLSVFLADAVIDVTTTMIDLSSIQRPTGYDVQVGDIVISSYADTVGNFAYIINIDNVNVYIDYVDTLKGEKGDIGSGNNPNLLINPNFTINQRGQASYSGAVYGVDRWRGISSSITATPVANGIQLSSSETTNLYIKQIVETNLSGKTVTASCKLSAINSGEGGRFAIYYSTDGTSWTIIAGMTIATVGISKLTATIPANAVYVSVDVGVRPSSDVVFEWAKLEIGSVATEFSPSSIAEELPKCQRYYQIRTSAYTIQTNAIDRPIPMRANGTTGTTTINNVEYNYCDAEF